MKKFLKVTVTLSAVAAGVAGALYFFKNIVMKDYLDDYDDDLDNDLFDELGETSGRDYVKLHSDEEKKSSLDTTTVEKRETTSETVKQGVWQGAEAQEPDGGIFETATDFDPVSDDLSVVDKVKELAKTATRV